MPTPKHINTAVKKIQSEINGYTQDESIEKLADFKRQEMERHLKDMTQEIDDLMHKDYES